jgi:hypothetical protein
MTSIRENGARYIDTIKCLMDGKQKALIEFMTDPHIFSNFLVVDSHWTTGALSHSGELVNGLLGRPW